ncbi:MAG TPA: NUDIX domain-containing protein [Chitinophagaceae bacterium]|nr:NUDIX domain-containing protein [Chitinophagaceae bacterium]
MKAIRQSAGILLYRWHDGVAEVFLVHPGGPFWAKKDAGAWSIPKGEFTGEEPLAAAKREFMEETGTLPGMKNVMPLVPVQLKSGKMVYAFAGEGDIEADKITSNLCRVEWPPKTGKMIEVPEVDRAGWFGIDEARFKINISQAAFINELAALLNL